MSPLVTTLLLATLGIAVLVRAARRYLRNEARHSSQPREVRLSILSGIVLGVLFLALAAACLGIVAGLSRYRPLGNPPSLVLSLEPEGSRFRVSAFGAGLSPNMTPVAIEQGWFSLVAETIVWHGPLRWAGFSDGMRPCALLSARDRESITQRDRIRRATFSPDGLFERLAKGPGSSLGLCSFGEIRTPWRPSKAGSQVSLFTERGDEVVLAP